MEKLLSRLQGRRAALLVLGLGSTTVAVFMLALIGFFSLGTGGGDDDSLIAGPGSSETTTEETTDGTTDTTLSPTDPNAPGGVNGTGPGGTGPGGTTVRTTKEGKPFIPEAPPPPGEAPLPKGGNATGVSANSIKYGVHAPITFDTRPVPLAGPVVRGIEAYINHLNANGGINGRAIDLIVADDEFTPRGADKAANTLIHDRKVFFVAGTLGVDQIKVVASEANKAKVPYFAGGGHEPLFKDMGVFQILSSYDTHMEKLAAYIAKNPALKGKKIGTFSSNTPQIAPVVTLFDRELKKYGMSVTIDRKVEKPEIQLTRGYAQIILDYKTAGVQVVVPMTDPINTSQLVGQCGTGESNCPWTYTFSNFAHEGETALALFGDEWGRKKVSGLAGGCYPNAPDAQLNDVNKCGMMGVAKQQFNAVKGDPQAWTKTQNDKWGTSAGYNSGAGYQWLFFKKAMLDQGTEVTRERLRAAILRYRGYRDLITGPITYKNSPNLAHGAEKMVVFEAQTQAKYKMISDGMVDGF